MTEEEIINTSSRRLISIDLFKAISIILMVYVNTLRPYENVPAWSKHAVDYGLTFVDLIAPFFIFMLAINTKLSYTKRLKNYGRQNAILRHLRRFLILIGVGLLFTMYVGEDGFYLRWGTLEVLGSSGLLLLFVVELKYYYRLIFGFLLMLVHQTFLNIGLASIIYDGIEGGIVGIFGWGSMAIFSSVLGEGLKKNKPHNHFIFGGIFCIVIALISAPFLSISRQYISIPYIFITVGISSILFYIFFWIFEKGLKIQEVERKLKIIVVLSKNAFILFLIHIITISFIYEIFPFDIPYLVIISIGILNVIIIWFIAYLLDKGDMYLIV